MNEGLVAGITALVEETVDGDIVKLIDESFEAEDELPSHLYKLPPDIALAGFIGTDPKTLDEVLHGPNAKEWQEALEYEIGQLEKLEMWVVEDQVKALYCVAKCSGSNEVQMARSKAIGSE